MTFINKMIRDAKDGAEILYVKPNHVRKLAAHAHSLMMQTPRPCETEDIERMIRAGEMKMLGVPVKVSVPVLSDNSPGESQSSQ